MFKCIDHIVGEVVTAPTLKILCFDIAERVEEYGEKGFNFSLEFVDGTYYIKHI